MLNYKLLEKDAQNERGGMLISSKSVEQVICLIEQSFLKIKIQNEVTVALIEELNSKIDIKVNLSDFFEDEMKETLNEWLSNYVNVIEISNAQDYEQKEFNTLLFNGKYFTDLIMLDTMYHYEYHDGHNNVNVDWEDDTDLIVSNDYYSLDEYSPVTDGYNSGSRFYHENVRKILSVDGETAKDTFLLIESTQWQGDHDTAVILTRDELIAHIEELGDRDIEKYMKQIDLL